MRGTAPDNLLYCNRLLALIRNTILEWLIDDAHVSQRTEIGQRRWDRSTQTVRVQISDETSGRIENQQEQRFERAYKYDSDDMVENMSGIDPCNKLLESDLQQSSARARKPNERTNMIDARAKRVQN